MKKLLIVILILFLAPFVSADWYWNAFTQQLDYYEPVSGADLGDLNNVVFTLSATGNLIYYNGTNWVNLATGTNGQILHLAAGIPAWITAIAPDHGGTGLIGYAIGDLIYADGATSLARLADVALGQVLTSGGVGVAPSWSGTPSVLTLGVNYGGATGESGINFNSINSTFSIIAQSDAEGIGNSSDLRIGLDETMRTLILCDRGDIGTDFTLSAAGDPTLYIYDETAAFHMSLEADIIKAGSSMTFVWATWSSNRPLTFEMAKDRSADNAVSFVSFANAELTSSDGQQAFVYIEPKVLQTSTAAFDGIHLNVNGTVTDTYGDGTSGDGNNLLRLSDNGTTIYKFNLTGAYHFKETTTPTAVTNYGALYTKTDNLLYFQDGSGNENVVGGIATFKSYTFVSRDAASGEIFQAGFYDYAVLDANLNQGSLTVTHGESNHPYAAHVFIVSGGNGTTDDSDLVLTVSGTSILDDGTRVGGDEEIIEATATVSALNSYYETTRKWLGTITLTLSSAGGSTFSYDFNYGFAKYEDFGNRDFTITDFEAVGVANLSDSGFNIELLHHKATGWTYAASGFVAGTTALLSMNTIHSTEQDLNSDEPFAFKRAGLSISVDGDGSEGIIIRLTTATSNSVSYMDSHVGVKLK